MSSLPTPHLPFSTDSKKTAFFFFFFLKTDVLPVLFTAISPVAKLHMTVILIRAQV